MEVNVLYLLLKRVFLVHRSSEGALTCSRVQQTCSRPHVPQWEEVSAASESWLVTFVQMVCVKHLCWALGCQLISKNIWMNEAFIYRFIVYCCTPKALYNHVGVSPQPPPVCSIHLDDTTASHRTTAPVRSPHTSYRWRGERDRANQVDYQVDMQVTAWNTHVTQLFTTNHLE